MVGRAGEKLSASLGAWRGLLASMLSGVVSAGTFVWGNGFADGCGRACNFGGKHWDAVDAVSVDTVRDPAAAVLRFIHHSVFVRVVLLRTP